jgi:glycosyltransferase involved in cell wall biosynthesis
MLPHLIAAGVDAEVLAFRPSEDLDWRSEDDGAPVFRELAGEQARFGALRRTLAIRHHLARGRYEVVHWALTGWPAILNYAPLRRAGIPLIHEMILLGSDDPLAIRGYRQGDLKLRLMRDLDAWVGITERFRAAIVGAGIPEERFHCIYGGVDVDRYHPRGDAERKVLRERLGIPVEARVAVSVGAVILRKGFDRAIRAWAETRPEAGRDLLLIVGPTTVEEGLEPHDAEHAGELEQLVRALGVSETVRLVGRVAEVEDWLAASDLFLFLSRREGLGYVTLEAMACGLPCILSPLDGIARELVDEGETGFIAEDPEDAAAVGSLLEWLLGDAERVVGMGAAARRAAEERFSMAARARRLAALHRELVARAVSSRTGSR